MPDKIKIAVIGLDTVHSIQYPGYIQDPKTPEAKKVAGAVVTRCLRFPSVFQSEEDQDKRQKYLESIGVKVTRDFDEAVADCDAIMIEINDPALHKKYFKMACGLGKPVYLDKPFAATMDEAKEMIKYAEKTSTRFCTSSCRRFDAYYNDRMGEVDFPPKHVNVWGSLGTGPEGTSIFVWYSVHEFEILERIMGLGAESVMTSCDETGFVCHVNYKDGRRGVVEGCYASESYGILIRNGLHEKYLPCCPNPSPASELIRELVKFFNGAPAPVRLEESLEIFAMSLAADRSAKTGKREKLVF